MVENNDAGGPGVAWMGKGACVLAAGLLAACGRGSPPGATLPASGASAAGPEASAAPLASGRAPRGGFFVLARGALAEVVVERALYGDGRPIDGGRFFVRVIVRNRSGRPLAVDLRDRWRTFYPNQWSRDDHDRRLVVDERRLPVGPLDPAARADLVARSRTPGALWSIPAGGEGDYYAVFDGPGGASLDGPGAFLIISLDGQLRLTDGEQIEQLALSDDPASRDLVIAGLARGRPIPAGARVIDSL